MMRFYAFFILIVSHYSMILSIKTEIPPAYGEIRDVPNESVRKIWISVTTEKSGKSPTLLLQNYQQIITITIAQF